MTRNDLSHPHGAGCILTCVLGALAQGLSYKRSHIDFAHESGVITLSSHGAVIGNFAANFERSEVQDALVQHAAEHRKAVVELVQSTVTAWSVPVGYRITKSWFPYEDGGPSSYVDFHLESEKPSFNPDQIHGVIRVFMDVPEVRYWYSTGHRHFRSSKILVSGPSPAEQRPMRTYPSALELAQQKMEEAFRQFAAERVQSNHQGQTDESL
jgi:hypothetical protein